MRRVQGTADAKLIECVNPAKDKWRIRWDVQEIKEDDQATYMEEEFPHKPTEEEIKATVIDWFNEQTDNSILHGFTYEDNVVWLSQENQFNYKAAYDLAIQTSGDNLPVTFKFGSDDRPFYRSFNTVEELSEFYNKAMKHIQNTLEYGWKAKDNFKLKDYDVN